MTTNWLLCILLLLAALLTGCVQADLGDAPLFCNEGSPRCPTGYVCKQISAGVEKCLREGYEPPASTATPVTMADGGVVETD